MADKPSKRQLIAEQDSTLYEILKDRASMVEQRKDVNRNRSFSLLAAQNQLFFDQLTEFTKELFDKNPVKVSGYAKKTSNKPVKREVNLVLSDLHIGANLDPRELPHKYGWQEEARRLAKVTLETAEYKTHYRDNTHLNINILGDIIQGILEHDPRDGNPLAEQCGAAAHLLIQSVSYLASRYPSVSVRCVPGNHGRNTSRHKSRAMHQKWDAFETIIYDSIRNGVRHFPNIKNFDIPYTPFYIYDSFGHHILGTHGDTFIDVGNPGNLINAKAINLKINEINATRPQGQMVEAVCVGHVHVSSRLRLPSGVVVFTNGALVPPDGFMVNGVGHLESVCSQTLWESTEKYASGDYRELVVDTDTDKDATLDKIIKPFSGF